MLGYSSGSGTSAEVYGTSTASTGGNTATSVYHGEAKGDDGAYVKGSSSAATDKYSAEANHEVEGAVSGELIILVTAYSIRIFSTRSIAP